MLRLKIILFIIMFFMIKKSSNSLIKKRVKKHNQKSFINRFMKNYLSKYKDRKILKKKQIKELLKFYLKDLKKSSFINKQTMKGLLGIYKNSTELIHKRKKSKKFFRKFFKGIKRQDHFKIVRRLNQKNFGKKLKIQSLRKLKNKYHNYMMNKNASLYLYIIKKFQKLMKKNKIRKNHYFKHMGRYLKKLHKLRFLTKSDNYFLSRNLKSNFRKLKRKNKKISQKLFFSMIKDFYNDFQKEKMLVNFEIKNFQKNYQKKKILNFGNFARQLNSFVKSNKKIKMHQKNFIKDEISYIKNHIYKNREIKSKNFFKTLKKRFYNRFKIEKHFLKSFRRYLKKKSNRKKSIKKKFNSFYKKSRNLKLISKWKKKSLFKIIKSFAKFEHLKKSLLKKNMVLKPERFLLEENSKKIKITKKNLLKKISERNLLKNKKIMDINNLFKDSETFSYFIKSMLMMKREFFLKGKYLGRNFWNKFKEMENLMKPASMVFYLRNFMNMCGGKILNIQNRQRVHSIVSKYAESLQYCNFLNTIEKKFFIRAFIDILTTGKMDLQGNINLKFVLQKYHENASEKILIAFKSRHFFKFCKEILMKHDINLQKMFSRYMDYPTYHLPFKRFAKSYLELNYKLSGEGLHHVYLGLLKTNDRFFNIPKTKLVVEHKLEFSDNLKNYSTHSNMEVKKLFAKNKDYEFLKEKTLRLIMKSYQKTFKEFKFSNKSEFKKVFHTYIEKLFEKKVPKLIIKEFSDIMGDNFYNKKSMDYKKIYEKVKENLFKEKKLPLIAKQYSDINNHVQLNNLQNQIGNKELNRLKEILIKFPPEKFILSIFTKDLPESQHIINKFNSHEKNIFERLKEFVFKLKEGPQIITLKNDLIDEIVMKGNVLYPHIFQKLFELPLPKKIHKLIGQVHEGFFGHAKIHFNVDKTSSYIFGRAKENLFKQKEPPTIMQIFTDQDRFFPIHEFTHREKKVFQKLKEFYLKEKKKPLKAHYDHKLLHEIFSHGEIMYPHIFSTLKEIPFKKPKEKLKIDYDEKLLNIENFQSQSKAFFGKKLARIKELFIEKKMQPFILKLFTDDQNIFDVNEFSSIEKNIFHKIKDTFKLTKQIPLILEEKNKLIKDIMTKGNMNYEYTHIFGLFKELALNIEKTKSLKASNGINFQNHKIYNKKNFLKILNRIKEHYVAKKSEKLFMNALINQTNVEKYILNKKQLKNFADFKEYFILPDDDSKKIIAKKYENLKINYFEKFKNFLSTDFIKIFHKIKEIVTDSNQTEKQKFENYLHLTKQEKGRGTLKEFHYFNRMKEFNLIKKDFPSILIKGFEKVFKKYYFYNFKEFKGLFSRYIDIWKNHQLLTAPEGTFLKYNFINKKYFKNHEYDFSSSILSKYNYKVKTQINSEKIEFLKEYLGKYLNMNFLRVNEFENDLMKLKLKTKFNFDQEKLELERIISKEMYNFSLKKKFLGLEILKHTYLKKKTEGNNDNLKYLKKYDLNDKKRKNNNIGDLTKNNIFKKILMKKLNKILEEQTVLKFVNEDKKIKSIKSVIEKNKSKNILHLVKNIYKKYSSFPVKKLIFEKKMLKFFKNLEEEKNNNIQSSVLKKILLKNYLLTIEPNSELKFKKASDYNFLKKTHGGFNDKDILKITKFLKKKDLDSLSLKFLKKLKNYFRNNSIFFSDENKSVSKKVFLKNLPKGFFENKALKYLQEKLGKNTIEKLKNIKYLLSSKSKYKYLTNILDKKLIGYFKNSPYHKNQIKLASNFFKKIIFEEESGGEANREDAYIPLLNYYSELLEAKKKILKSKKKNNFSKKIINIPKPETKLNKIICCSCGCDTILTANNCGGCGNNLDNKNIDFINKTDEMINIDPTIKISLTLNKEDGKQEKSDLFINDETVLIKPKKNPNTVLLKNSYYNNNNYVKTSMDDIYAENLNKEKDDLKLNGIFPVNENDQKQYYKVHFLKEDFLGNGINNGQVKLNSTKNFNIRDNGRLIQHYSKLNITRKLKDDQFLI